MKRQIIYSAIVACLFSMSIIQGAYYDETLRSEFTNTKILNKSDVDCLFDKNLANAGELTKKLHTLTGNHHEGTKIEELLSGHNLGTVSSALSNGYGNLALFLYKRLENNQKLQSVVKFFENSYLSNNFPEQFSFLLENSYRFNLDKTKIEKLLGLAFSNCVQNCNWENAYYISQRKDYFTTTQRHIDFWFYHAFNKRDSNGIESLLNKMSICPSENIFRQGLEIYIKENNTNAVKDLLNHANIPVFYCNEAFLLSVKHENHEIFDFFLNQTARPLSEEILKEALKITPRKPSDSIVSLISSIISSTISSTSHPMHMKIYELLGMDDPNDFSLRLKRMTEPLTLLYTHEKFQVPQLDLGALLQIKALNVPEIKLQPLNFKEFVQNESDDPA